MGGPRDGIGGLTPRSGALLVVAPVLGGLCPGDTGTRISAIELTMIEQVWRLEVRARAAAAG